MQKRYLSSEQFIYGAFSPISHPFLPITSNPHRNLVLTNIANPGNLYIDFNLGTSNK